MTTLMPVDNPSRHPTSSSSHSGATLSDICAAMEGRLSNWGRFDVRLCLSKARSLDLLWFCNKASDPVSAVIALGRTSAVGSSATLLFLPVSRIPFPCLSTSILLSLPNSPRASTSGSVSDCDCKRARMPLCFSVANFCFVFSFTPFLKAALISGAEDQRRERPLSPPTPGREVAGVHRAAKWFPFTASSSSSFSFSSWSSGLVETGRTRLSLSLFATAFSLLSACISVSDSESEEAAAHNNGCVSPSAILLHFSCRWEASSINPRGLTDWLTDFAQTSSNNGHKLVSCHWT